MAAMRGMILDVDGTLIASNDAHASAYVAAMAENGFPGIPVERLRALIGMGGDKLLPAAIGIASDSKVGKAIEDDRKKIFKRDYLPHLQPTPGAANLIARLHADGVQMVVATSGQPDDVKALLDIVGVRKILTEMVTAADVESSKPAPDIVGEALKRLGLPLDAVHMLGDTPYDIQAGKRAGIDVIVVRCGGWDDEGLRGALSVYDDPADYLLHLTPTKKDG